MNRSKTRAVTLAGAPSAPVTLRCTIRWQSGGWVPLLHPTCLEPPEPAPHAVSFPDVPAATRFARAQYGDVHVVVVEAGRSSG